METEHGDCLLFHGYHVTNLMTKSQFLITHKVQTWYVLNQECFCTLCTDDSLLPFKEAYQKKISESKQENSIKLNLPELFQFLSYIIL